MNDIDFHDQYSARKLFWLTFALYRRYPALFTLLAFGVIVPFECVVLITTGSGPLAHGGANKFEISLITALSFSLVAPLISALHARAIMLMNEEQAPTLGRVVSRSVGVLPVVIAADLVANIAIGIGMIAFIIPGVVLWMRWSVVAQTAAIEGKGLVDSLRRCGQLTYGYYLHIFGLLLMVGIFVVFLNRISEALPLGNTSNLSSVVIGIIIHTFVASVTALSGAVLYFDLRARQDSPKAIAREYQYARDLDS